MFVDISMIKKNVCLYEFAEKYYNLKLDVVKGNNRFYQSIFLKKKQKTGSLIIDNKENIFNDFATGISGNIFDFVMNIEKCDFTRAKDIIVEKCGIKELKNKSLDLNLKKKNENKIEFNKVKIKENKKEIVLNYEILLIKDIENKMFIEYLESRGINYLKVNEFIKEIIFERNDRSYFGICFKNIKNGYEIRGLNNFKTSLGSKAITYINNKKRKAILTIFEGFMDFLTFYQMYEDLKDKFDFMVLNSVSTLNIKNDYNKNYLDKLIKIKEFEEVWLILDNDQAGRDATEDFIEYFESKNISCLNYSKKMFKEKDLNEFYVSKCKNLKL